MATFYENTDPFDIRDPASRKLKTITDSALANKGDIQKQENLPAVNVPDTFQSRVDAATKRVSGEREEGEKFDTGIRESIMQGVRGEFQKGLADVQERALGARRFRAGSTSAAELAVVDAATDRLAGRLGDFELGARKDILAALGPLAKAEIEGITDRDVVWRQGLTAQSVAHTGAEAAKEVAKTGAAATTTAATTAAEAAIEISEGKITSEEKLAFGYVDEEDERVEGFLTADSRRVDNEAKKIEVDASYHHLAVMNSLFEQQVSKADHTGLWEELGSDTLANFAKAMGQSERGIDFDEQFDVNKDGIVDLDDYVLLGEDPEVAALPTIAERDLAIREDTAAVNNYINRVQSDLTLASHLFDTQVRTAEITGVWASYGKKEIDAYVATFNHSEGDANFNANYDFNGSGTVDFNDWSLFVRFAETGIPTLEAKEFNERIRQTAVTEENWKKEFDEMVRTNNLNRSQQFNLALAALQSNVQVAASQLNVGHIANLLDFVVDYEGAITDQDISYIIDTAKRFGDLEEILGVTDEHKRKVELIVGEGGTNELTQEIEELLGNSEAWNLENIDAENMTKEEIDALHVKYDMADIDGDGKVDLGDLLLYNNVKEGKYALI